MVVMKWGHGFKGATDILQDNSLVGAYIATRYLIENGHHRIGIITGDLNKELSVARLEGFKKAMIEAQLPIKSEWIKEGFFNPEDGYELMLQILELDHYPSAMFCCNDMMALGAMSAISEKGLCVPRDISIIGYDDIHSSRFFSPPLTTVSQPKQSLGEQAAVRLFTRISQKSIQFKNSQPNIIEFMPELVIRKSVTQYMDT